MKAYLYWIWDDVFRMVYMGWISSYGTLRRCILRLVLEYPSNSPCPKKYKLICPLLEEYCAFKLYPPRHVESNHYPCIYSLKQRLIPQNLTQSCRYDRQEQNIHPYRRSIDDGTSTPVLGLSRPSSVGNQPFSLRCADADTRG